MGVTLKRSLKSGTKKNAPVIKVSLRAVTANQETTYHSNMITTPPKFNYRDISKWRSIDLRLTMDIAHRCTRGVNFQGCSKSQIIEGIARPCGYSSDAPKFITLMDAASRFYPRLKADLDQAVAQKLDMIIEELNL